MPLTVTTKSGKDFEALSEGVHNAVLGKIIDIGMVRIPREYQKPGGATERHQVVFVFITDEADEDGKAKLAFAYLSVSLHSKSTMRKVIKALTGTDPAETMDIALAPGEKGENLLGRKVTLGVEQYENAEGRTKAKIITYMKASPSNTLTIPSGWDFAFKDGKSKQDDDIPF